MSFFTIESTFPSRLRSPHEYGAGSRAESLPSHTWGRVLAAPDTGRPKRPPSVKSDAGASSCSGAAAAAMAHASGGGGVPARGGTFQAAAGFQGIRPGHVFKLGAQGVGYYASVSRLARPAPLTPAPPRPALPAGVRCVPGGAGLATESHTQTTCHRKQQILVIRFGGIVPMGTNFYLAV